MSQRLVVALEDNLLAVPTQFLFEKFAVCVNHLVQTADVGVHVFALADNFANVVLYITSKPGPVSFSTAKRGEVVEIRMSPLKL